MIRENFKFAFNCDKTDITPTVLDGGNETILANWPDNKHIICNVSNDIPFKIPNHPYALVNRSILCNCGIETENNFLLESLAACHDSNSKLAMYFIVYTSLSIICIHYLNTDSDLPNKNFFFYNFTIDFLHRLHLFSLQINILRTTKM